MLAPQANMIMERPSGITDQTISRIIPPMLWPSSVLPANVNVQVIWSAVAKLSDVGTAPMPLGCAAPPNATFFVCSASVTAFASSSTG